MFDRVKRVYILRYDSKESADRGLSLMKKIQQNKSEFFDSIDDVGVSVNESSTLFVLCQQYVSSVRSWNVYLEANKKNLGLKDFESYSMY